MQKILSLIQKHYKVTTATQIGLDTNMLFMLPEYFWSVTAIDDKSEWSSKVLEQLDKDVCNPFLYSNIESELLDDLEYLNYETDFIYIHNRHSAEFKRLVFNHFLKKKTKFILTHPSVITSNPNKYQKITFNTIDGTYKLLYLDPIYEELEEYFRNKSNESN